eukprot:1319032-Prorocentrum_lima.AAC.1
MTSSLVGSEMCIRDRGMQRNPSRGTAADRSRLTLSTAFSSGTAARRPGPVSYTHLTLPTICSV